MRKLLLILAVSVLSFIYQYPLQSAADWNPFPHSEKPSLNLSEINTLLHRPEAQISELVIQKVLASLNCVQNFHVDYNDILTVIDYSLPANQKRLWVFDLKAKKLLYYTYVSHGLTSGALITNFFSNINNSKASSIGIYKTEDAYFGRDGISLRLQGLDPGFNDNAGRRYVVIHGGWYTTEAFIKKYGRPGRSWGCPAVPLELAKDIIHTIKNQSLLVIYYPSNRWFTHSKFLNCQHYSPIAAAVIPEKLPEKSQVSELRGPILFADLNNNSNQEESEPVIALSADEYAQFFHVVAPVERMLRRQMFDKEFVVLNPQELQQLAGNPLATALYFVTAHVKMERGYYRTEMQPVLLGKIKDVTSLDGSFGLSMENRSPIHIRTTNAFIRWVGL